MVLVLADVGDYHHRFLLDLSSSQKKNCVDKDVDVCVHFLGHFRAGQIKRPLINDDPVWLRQNQFVVHLDKKMQFIYLRQKSRAYNDYDHLWK